MLIFRQPNYNIMSQHQAQETLFDDPHQLLAIRDQLTGLLNSDQSIIPHLLSYIESEITALLETLSHKDSADLYRAVLELNEAANQQQSNVSALSHLTIKMIDYIREQQQLHKSQIQQYEHALDELRGQLDFMTHKNITIEGDVEMFREQLIAAQSQLQEIAVVDSEHHEKEIPMDSRDGEERQRRIQELEGQLQKIKEHINLVKFQSLAKRSAVNLTPKTLAANRSQRYIPSSGTNPIIEANNELLEQQIYYLRQKLKQLSSQNQQLRNRLQENANKMINSAFKRSYKIRDSLNYQIEEKAQRSIRPNRTEKMLPKITSFSNFTPDNQNVYLQHQQIRHLVPDQSTEKFHTLHSEVSSKSFEVNLNQYNVDAHLANFIFLGEDNEKVEGWQVQQTGETENSMPHITSEIIRKAFSTVGINTDQNSGTEGKTQKSQSQECVCASIKKSLNSAVSSFFHLRDLAVSKRINHKLKRPNKTDKMC